MAWFGTNTKTDAEKSLEGLTADTTPALASGAPPSAGDEDDLGELYVTLRETPAARTPGTRLKVRKGKQVGVCPWTDAESRLSEVRAVEERPDGHTALLLAKRDASPIASGDEIVYFEGAIA